MNVFVEKINGKKRTGHSKEILTKKEGFIFVEVTDRRENGEE